ncbi:two-component system response regulator [Heliophilum fasciatum]|uniref:Stage 0 sporulation protein A homolog n=1 Tax=Heliophilum fasciatum TaxID=35700 RepID=A0A4R2RWI4_9FIRM|nr:diguanylate cyclase [Heliophilum fasciatum]MCW2278049.1 diguanylate cyclase (GGDEF)-like protein/PAS domain S-box-containing protein [Heliophilum fasciatum]TCP64331.1 response regulator receiver modulated diguanylate cyclase/phosphodiesterase with PAS/PAC sensor [Heliophilum fasciatum]
MKQNQTILIVDDDPVVRLMLRRTVEHAGFRVIEAENGKEALQTAQEQMPDLILLDVMMPILDGFETLEQLRKLPGGDRVPILMVTALDDKNSVQRAFSAGADDYLKKPIHLEVLRHKVQRLFHARAVEESLIASEIQMRGITSALGAGVYVVDQEGILVFMNPEAERLLGWREGELLGKPVNDLFRVPAEAEQKEEKKHLYADEAMPVPHVEETNFRHRDGTVFPVALVSSPYYTAGVISGTVAIFHDISLRKQAEHRLRMIAKVFEHTAEGIMVTDSKGRIQSVNRGFCNTTGYTEDEVVGQTPRILQSGRYDREFYREFWDTLINSGYWEGEIWNRRKDGAAYAVWLTISAIKDDYDRTIQYAAVFHDITEQKQAHERIQYQAYHDALTDLPNRSLFLDRLHQAVALALRNKRKLAVFFLDLDRFKQINDIYGHMIGDELLQGVARRLRSCLRESDTVARLGGDEFTVILPDISESDDAAVVAKKVLEALCVPWQLSGHIIQTTASIGIAMYPQDGKTVAELINHADTAMYRAKQSGRNKYQFFAEKMADGIDEKSAILRTGAMDFVMEYAPIIALASGKLLAFEGQALYPQSEGGWSLTADLLTHYYTEEWLTQEAGRIVAKVSEQIKQWSSDGPVPLRGLVELAPAQFLNLRLPEQFRRIVWESGLDPAQIEIAVPSTVVDHKEAALCAVEQYRKAGFTTCLTRVAGQHSLASLFQQRFDAIRLDENLIQTCLHSPEKGHLLVTLIYGMQRLGRRVIAAGVLDQATAQWLIQENCQEAQGAYFGSSASSQIITTMWEKQLWTR